jgi:alkyl hydroperoxide reductase subunit AhpC
MRLHLGLISGIIWGMAAAASLAAPQIGQPAPDFTAEDTNGEAITLSDLAGQQVILEWTNHQCPFVGKHYSSGNMQTLQKETTAEGVVWLSIISSAPGEQGYVTAAEANALTESRDAVPTAVILDPEGEIGRLYGARTTPHMFVIDGEGTLQYMGAIDSIPSAQTSDLESAENYVRSALAELEAGDTVSTPATQPYGCTVKYKG